MVTLFHYLPCPCPMMILRHKTPVQTIGGHFQQSICTLKRQKKLCLIHTFTAFQKKNSLVLFTAKNKKVSLSITGE